MEVFIHRAPTGYLMNTMGDVKELEEFLDTGLAFDSFDDDSLVRAEISGTWREVRELLSHPCFNGEWSNPPESGSFPKIADGDYTEPPLDPEKREERKGEIIKAIQLNGWIDVRDRIRTKADMEIFDELQREQDSTEASRRDARLKKHNIYF